MPWSSRERPLPQARGFAGRLGTALVSSVPVMTPKQILQIVGICMAGLGLMLRRFGFRTVLTIGALGYFTRRPLLDLAGLISPEVIPFIRDEARIRTFIRERGAGYAILFPDWYPRLAEDSGLARVFTTGCALTREQGGQNLSVYQVNR